jgi:SAM-dependent methyltransferase
VSEQGDLASHPDQIRWDERYRRSAPSFTPHPLAERALSMELPDGPVADLACGPSGSALLAAGQGRQVVAVDVSRVALDLLADEARRRGLDHLIRRIHADLARWRPSPDRYALVLCTGFWDRAVFSTACAAVRPGGLLGWEAFTQRARLARPSLPEQWCLAPGEPSSLLPAAWRLIEQRDLAADEGGEKRRMLARHS